MKSLGYIGQASKVDEYIGQELTKLIITFVKPQAIGLNPEYFPRATVGNAICARVGLRNKPIDMGWLIHLIGKTSKGVEMICRFWLGDIRLRIPLLGHFIDKRINTAQARHKLVPDQLGLDLLLHCAEEMNHLARFIPVLYQAETKI